MTLTKLTFYVDVEILFLNNVGCGKKGDGENHQLTQLFLRVS